MFSKQWGGHTAGSMAFFTDYGFLKGACWDPCGDAWPDEYCNDCMFNAEAFPDGEYIGYAVNFMGTEPVPYTRETAYTVFEFTIDLE